MLSLFRRSGIKAVSDQPSVETAEPAEPQPLNGYEASLLADVVLAKTKALRREDIPCHAGAERTMLSVLLAERVTRSDPLRVLDFGGACGLHYMAARLIGIPLRWAVVETPVMVEKASELATDNLRFFADIAEAMRWIGGVDLMFSAGALQYLHDPDAILHDIVALRAPLMMWSRLSMSDGYARQEVQVARLADNGPGPMPAPFTDRKVRYPKTYLSQIDFVSAHSGYSLVFRSGDLEAAEFAFLRNDLNL